MRAIGASALCVLLAVACGDADPGSVAETGRDVESATPDSGAADGSTSSSSSGEQGSSVPEGGSPTCGAVPANTPFDSVEQQEAFLDGEWAWSSCDDAPIPWCNEQNPQLLFRRIDGVLRMQCGRFCGAHSTGPCADQPSLDWPVTLEPTPAGGFSLRWEHAGSTETLELASRTAPDKQLALCSSTRSILLCEVPRYVN